MHDERLGARLPGLGVGDVAVLLHAADHVIAALDRAVVVAERVQRRGLFRQRGEIGDLGDGEFVHGLVEIVQRGGGDAVIAEAEVDFVKVKLENLVLGIGGLDAQAQQDLADLALDRAVRAQQEVLGDLLGDGRGALDVPVALQKHDRRAHDALGIEAAMAVEILVFGRDEGVLDEIGDGGGGQIEPPLVRIFGEQAAVGGVHARHHRRLVILQVAVVGQILLELEDDERRRRRNDDEDDRAGGEQKPQESPDVRACPIPRSSPPQARTSPPAS